MSAGMKTTGKRTQKKANQKTNKRITAAAFDLYEACWSILTTCEDMGLDDLGALQDVRHALSRAEGKTIREKQR